MKANLVGRQGRKFGRLETFDRRRHPQRCGPFSEFASGHHRHNTLGGTRRLAVDRDNAGMSMRRTHEMRVQATGHNNVVEIAALPGDQAIILLARQCCADGALVAHRTLSPRRRAAAFTIAATMLW